MEGCERPNRSDTHISSAEEAKIEDETREYFDGLAPKRHAKPQRSEFSSNCTDNPAALLSHSEENTNNTELLAFQRLEHDDPQKLVFKGSEETEEFVETDYYKDLNSIDKQHHTTGTGFINTDNGSGKSFSLVEDTDTAVHASSHGNPATNEWIPAEDNTVPETQKASE